MCTSDNIETVADVTYYILTAEFGLTTNVYEWAYIRKSCKPDLQILFEVRKLFSCFWFLVYGGVIFIINYLKMVQAMTTDYD